jgi:hypothetical protein
VQEGLVKLVVVCRVLMIDLNELTALQGGFMRFAAWAAGAQLAALRSPSVAPSPLSSLYQPSSQCSGSLPAARPAPQRKWPLRRGPVPSLCAADSLAQRRDLSGRSQTRNPAGSCRACRIPHPPLRHRRRRPLQLATAACTYRSAGKYAGGATTRRYKQRGLGRQLGRPTLRAAPAGARAGAPPRAGGRRGPCRELGVPE